jgi:hypothetical protein
MNSREILFFFGIRADATDSALTDVLNLITEYAGKGIKR